MLVALLLYVGLCLALAVASFTDGAGVRDLKRVPIDALGLLAVLGLVVVLLR